MKISKTISTNDSLNINILNFT